MKKGPTWLFLLTIMILSSGRSAAVKIEDKNGRAIEAEIVEADEEHVTIIRTKDKKVFPPLERNTLSPGSNALIDEFLETRKEEEAKKNIGKVEVIVKGGDLGDFKFRMKPPVKSLRPFAHNNEMTVGVDNGDAEPLFFFIKTESEPNADTAKYTKEKANGFKEGEASLKEVQCGEWSGYILENQPAYAEGRGFFHQGDFSLHFVYSRKANGIFREEMIPALIESITIDKVEQPSKR